MSSHDAWIWGVSAGVWCGVVFMSLSDRRAPTWRVPVVGSVVLAVVMFGGAVILKWMGQ